MSRFFKFFLRLEVRAAFCGFALFLRGVLGKSVFLAWCLDGDFVVDCMADVDAKQ